MYSWGPKSLPLTMRMKSIYTYEKMGGRIKGKTGGNLRVFFQFEI